MPSSSRCNEGGRHLRRALILAAMLLPCGVGAQARGDSWALGWDSLARPGVEFRGVLDRDGAGVNTGQMMYPAPNAAGLLVAILTHAAVNEGVQRAQANKLQQRADLVVAPYQGIVALMTPEGLMTQARGFLSGAATPMAEARWRLELVPAFWMTQDSRALIVQAEAGWRDASVPNPQRRAAVTVVSDPLLEENAVEAWSSKEGELLVRRTAQLLAMAAEALAGDLPPNAADEGRHRTVRYLEGRRERMERAQVLQQRCGRALLRTLTGELKSVPLSNPPEAEAGCPAAVPAPPRAAPVASEAASAPG
ncbi:hypothetical protein [Roseateles sp. P5_E1]